MAAAGGGIGCAAAGTVRIEVSHGGFGCNGRSRRQRIFRLLIQESGRQPLRIFPVRVMASVRTGSGSARFRRWHRRLTVVTLFRHELTAAVTQRSSLDTGAQHGIPDQPFFQTNFSKKNKGKERLNLERSSGMASRRQPVREKWLQLIKSRDTNSEE